ncbi:MAG TPA: hypothetical protein VF179_10185 [Thermoanaerobaculia bacterium]|nr:hypothetical protein [Thermoanaerobaculia bacterium]
MDAEARAVIGYWASLAWRGVALTWQNVTLFEPGKAPVSRSSLASASPPGAGGGAISWRAEALGCGMDFELRLPPIEERLLEKDAGIVEWRVEAPAAEVSVSLRGFAPLRGTGYAERILITIPPWRLPIRELRWGRWIDEAASRSVVWIDWRGESPRTWVFVDGIAAGPSEVTDESVRGGASQVVLGERRALQARTLAEIASSIPPLRAVVPRSFLGLRQSRWCSDGILREGDAAPLAGRAIHEVVVLR